MKTSSKWLVVVLFLGLGWCVAACGCGDDDDDDDSASPGDDDTADDDTSTDDDLEDDADDDTQPDDDTGDDDTIDPAVQELLDSGRNWLKIGEGDKARVDFSAALDIDPDVVEAQYGMVLGNLLRHFDIVSILWDYIDSLQYGGPVAKADDRDNWLDNILNDLLDLNDDRRHVRKRSRPFASGQLPIRSGLIAFPLLLVIAFGLGTSLLPISFTLGLSCYYALTLAYSLWLKRRMVIDVMALAALYTLRIIVGAIALGIALSFWLLAFSMFLFLSLALVKRYAELFHVRTQSANNNKAHGRGYFAADLPMIASLGAASGYMAVMVLALYVNDAQTAQLYRHQQIIWFACPLMLTWISRVWMLAHRGVMDEDPVIFAVRDRPSLVVGALIALVFLAAT